MGKKPKPSKTPLGDRLIKVRERLGFSNRRAAFAATVLLTEPMLGYYERGDRTPDALALSEYHAVHGINLSWLITGQGDMFDDPSKAPVTSLAVDPWVMGRAYAVAERIYKDVGHPVSGNHLAEEAAALYSALVGRVADIRDKPIVEAALPILAEDLRARLKAAEPGSGKRSAS